MTSLKRSVCFVSAFSHLRNVTVDGDEFRRREPSRVLSGTEVGSRGFWGPTGYESPRGRDRDRVKGPVQENPHRRSIFSGPSEFCSFVVIIVALGEGYQEGVNIQLFSLHIESRPVNLKDLKSQKELPVLSSLLSNLVYSTRYSQPLFIIR